MVFDKRYELVLSRYVCLFASAYTVANKLFTRSVPGPGQYEPRRTYVGGGMIHHPRFHAIFQTNYVCNCSACQSGDSESAHSCTQHGVSVHGPPQDYSFVDYATKGPWLSYPTNKSALRREGATQNAVRYKLPAAIGRQPDSTKRSSPEPSFPRAPCSREAPVVGDDAPARAQSPGPAAYSLPESFGAQPQSDKQTAPSYTFGHTQVRVFLRSGSHLPPRKQR